MDALYLKLEKLKSYLQSLERVAVAFSGGVDSTFLLKIAHDALGKNAIAVTARSLSFPKRELDESIDFARKNDIKHIVVDFEELNIEGFAENPLNRCYLCKTELFTKMKNIAKQHGIQYIAEGSNTDDDGDYRPGLTAVTELGIKSPLRLAALSKEEIRILSKELGLNTWNKPSFACLASRFPYGEKITPNKLSSVDAAEQFLLDSGFHQVRVRYHDNLARIETDENGFELILDKNLRERIYKKFKQIGFTYVSIDLLGYRTGSMNETL